MNFGMCAFQRYNDIDARQVSELTSLFQFLKIIRYQKSGWIEFISAGRRCESFSRETEVAEVVQQTPIRYHVDFVYVAYACPFSSANSSLKHKAWRWVSARTFRDRKKDGAISAGL